MKTVIQYIYIYIYSPESPKEATWQLFSQNKLVPALY
jgi:hypothetical protein